MARALTKDELFESGCALVQLWCEANSVDHPMIECDEGDPTAFGVCAYYRSGVIFIDVAACAGLGHAGRQWSWPGYVVDRTPYGVLAHELAHHVEHAHGASGGVVAGSWRRETRSPTDHVLLPERQ